jgi:dTMP kinase
MERKERGKFIVIEGVGGAGKTTQINYASKLLEQNGLNVIKTREPGGIESAEEIRNLIFDLKEKKLIGHEGQMVLFFAARDLWLKNLVIPNLDNGINVLTDRCHTSTNAYQGYAEGGDKAKILKISEIILGDHKPDAVILLDISSETAIIRKEDKEGDPFDREDKKYLDRLVAGYREMAKEGWGDLKWYLVNGEKEVSKVNKEVKSVLEKIFEKALSS